MVLLASLLQSQNASAQPGTTLWEARHAPGDEYADAIAVSPDGRTVYVAGWRVRRSQAPVNILLAYPADGTGTNEPLWVRRFGQLGTRYQESMVVSPDGGSLFVSSDISVGAFDTATGAPIWVRRSLRNMSVTEIALSTDGRMLLMTGWAVRLGTDFVTAARVAASGAAVWRRWYDGPASDYDEATAIDVGPGAVYVSGWASAGTGDSDFVTIAYDVPTGSVLWSRRYDDAGYFDEPWDLAVSHDGSLIVVTGSGNDRVYRYLTLAYSNAGALQWAARYDGLDRADEVALAVTVSPDDSAAYVTGTSGNGELDYVTIGYDSGTGVSLWTSRYDHGLTEGFDQAADIGVAPNGSSVFVTGTSTDSTGSPEYATVSYASGNGAEQWVRRFDEPTAARGEDRASALAVDPGGAAVFVTGTTHGGGSGHDFGTIAYSSV